MISKKLFYINTRNRVSGIDSDFSWVFDFAAERYTHVCLMAINIPKSYYVVREGQNTFRLTEGLLFVDIEIPASNYNRSNFRQTVQSLLNTNSPNGWTYAVAVPDNTIGGDNGKF